MTILATALTAGRNNTNLASYTTASILPTAGKIAFVAVCHKGAGTPTVTGCGQTWTRIDTASWGATIRVHVFKALVASPISGALTIDFGADTQADACWSVTEFQNIGLSGVIQFANASSTPVVGAPSVTVTLAAFSDPNNATIGFFGADANSTGFSVGSGFTSVNQSTVSTESAILTEFKASADTSVDAGSGSGDIALAGIAIELHAGFTASEAYVRGGPRLSHPEEFIRGAPNLMFLEEAFVKSNPILSHPEQFIRGGPSGTMLRFQDIYLRGDPLLQVAAQRYINAESLLARHVESYVRGDVDFGEDQVSRYIRGLPTFAKNESRFVRGMVSFAYNADWIRGQATLALASNLPDSGDTPPTSTTPGIMSRQYLSVVSVKKEIT